MDLQKFSTKCPNRTKRSQEKLIKLDFLPYRSNKKLKDESGNRYSRILVKKFLGTVSGHSYWTCNCDCGTENLIVRAETLRTGHVQSCGCITSEGMNTKHRMTRTSTYNSWQAMKARCTNPNYLEYKYYGGRGIKICERWKDFSSFLEDMKEKPTKNHTLDRIDFNGDYCPENCRWSTPQEQSNNTRRNVRLEFRGESLTISQWASKLDVTYSMLKSRLKRRGNSAQLIQDILDEKMGRI